MDNLVLADQLASRGKSGQYGVQRHIKNRDEDLGKLQTMLETKTFRTSKYTTFEILEPKRREIFRLPYFPDRIVHHALMNVLESVWVSTFTSDTFSCIKRRGVHAAARKVQKALTDVDATKYCLKIDITKFYPSINHDILKVIIRKKIKDGALLSLLDSIIDSADGLPIGNYLSQYLANLYLTYFDHWVKEELKVSHYFRYCDDMVFLAGDKAFLHKILARVRGYLWKELRLTIKPNYQVFPVEQRGIDFLGYKFYHTHTMLRKWIKQRFARAVARGAGQATIEGYKGWAKHADTKHLMKKLSNDNDKKIQPIWNRT